MVYVISKLGKPLMPTKRHGMVRVLLREKRAKVIQNKPFTIQLLFETTEYVEPVRLGVDSGYKYIGYSAITDSEELISGELTLLDGQKDRLKTKSMYRTNRRNRLRYRKPRFDNRAMPKGWLANIFLYDIIHLYLYNIHKIHTIYQQNKNGVLYKTNKKEEKNMKNSKCTTCNGTGLENQNGSLVPCGACGGTGR